MKRKVEMLDRLFALLKCKVDLLQFLKEDGVITDDAMQRLLHENHTQHSIRIHNLMEQAVIDGKLQLVDYEWSILPLELVKLTLISNRGKKEFEYSI